MTSNVYAVLKGAAEEMIALEDQAHLISVAKAEVKQRVKSTGTPIKAFNFAVKLVSMGIDERDALLAGIGASCAALEVPIQGDMFGMPVAPAVLPDDDPSFLEVMGADADVPAEVIKIRRPHAYPRPKYAGGATGDVLADAFDGDDAA